ncbi:hypothetical protein OFAG_02338 [Oxalobacter formigenes HOxBLS]|uniref:Uncharacterized protein n=1 Tax=Oxalobacter paraformigenes TaxID=556268 RepID=T5LST3_9BURK|nr:hypothetical protein OFAG_02338 [Oxalobacter paraformigenes]
MMSDTVSEIVDALFFVCSICVVIACCQIPIN